MNLLNQSAFLKALGWALLDSIWQMGLLWLLYIVITANGKRLQARQRHSVALLSLSGGTLWFIITLIQYCYRLAEAPSIVTIHLNEQAVLPAASLTQQLYSWLEPSLSILSAIYLTVILVLFIRLYHQYRLTQQLFTHGLQKANPEWRAFLQQAVGHMGIKKNVQVWLSSMVDTPLTIGFWKPIILLPVAAINHLDLQQAEAIILHELNHIRRNDYLVNLLVACVDVILFFNPFARLITDSIRKEREHSCDDMVMQFRYNAGKYAKALLVLEQNRLSLPQLAVAATGNAQYLLLNRVKRLLTNEPVTAPFQQKLVAYLLSAVLIGFIGWYNPGKVIVLTIRETNATPANSIVVADNASTAFQTPAAIRTNTRISLQPIPVAADTIMHLTDTRVTEISEPDETLLAEEKALAVADEKLAAYKEYQKSVQDAANIVFVQNLEQRDFSMPPAPAAIPAPEAPGRVYPFVPSNSFSYQQMEDTTYPKNYIDTYSDHEAKLAMEKTLKALQEIDWQKLSKEMKVNGKDVDVVQLQQQLKKAVAAVNWKKINDESRAALQAAINDNVAQEQQEVIKFRKQLQNFQQQHAIQAQKVKKAQEQIILDRLQERDAIIILQKTEEKKQADSTPRRKIVVI